MPSLYDEYEEKKMIDAITSMRLFPCSWNEKNTYAKALFWTVSVAGVSAFVGLTRRPVKRALDEWMFNWMEMHPVEQEGEDRQARLDQIPLCTKVQERDPSLTEAMNAFSTCFCTTIGGFLVIGHIAATLAKPVERFYDRAGRKCYRLLHSTKPEI